MRKKSKKAIVYISIIGILFISIPALIFINASSKLKLEEVFVEDNNNYIDYPDERLSHYSGYNLQTSKRYKGPPFRNHLTYKRSFDNVSEKAVQVFIVKASVQEFFYSTPIVEVVTISVPYRGKMYELNVTRKQLSQFIDEPVEGFKVDFSVESFEKLMDKVEVAMKNKKKRDVFFKNYETRNEDSVGSFFIFIVLKTLRL